MEFVPRRIADERARVLAAINLLLPNKPAKLHTFAARGPAGMQLSPGAPLYVMNLVRAYKAVDLEAPA